MSDHHELRHSGWCDSPTFSLLLLFFSNTVYNIISHKKGPMYFVMFYLSVNHNTEFSERLSGEQSGQVNTMYTITTVVMFIPSKVLQFLHL